MVAKLFVIFTALVFFIYGLFFVFSPVDMLQTVVNGTMTSQSGVTDIRATYGGMSVAVGIILFILSNKPKTLQLALTATLILTVCMAVARLIGIFADGETNNFMFNYLWLEISVAVITAILILLNKPKPQS